MIKKKGYMKKSLYVILAALLAFIFSSQPLLFGQSERAKNVITIRVKGNKAVSTATILSKIKTQAGDRFSQDILNDDLKRLYAMGYFTDVAIDVEDYQEGVMVTIVVEEKPVIEDIVFSGNVKMKTANLKKAMQTKPGDMLNYSKIAQDITQIRQLYEKHGFHFVDVRYEVGVDKDIGKATVKIIIDEKQRIRVKKVSVEGNEHVGSKKILELMNTKPAWLLRRGYFDEEIFDEDMQKIKAFYADMGYLDVAIEPSFEFDEKKELMYITLKITEGSMYTAGEIKIDGELVFPESEVRKQLSMKEGDPFSYAKVSKDMDSIREFYYSKGYMNMAIAVERDLDSRTNVIGLTYDIKAGDVVYVGKVDIRGNTKTKDVVIRRELRIFPGERFDGDKIKRSKERLYNLGFFEDIYFDTKDTRKEDEKDLVVNVKETKTGEFSFGGGYSSVDEFIGFAQITQRNFDILNFPYFTGDGQNLAIRAEVGTVRRDFEISWTEPWILDYPLSFGFDLYNKTHLRRTDVGYGYEEVRSGGDVRFGKEFTDYVRGDLIYTLERVDISKLASDASQDLKDEEGDNWISSLGLGVTYDTRDNIYLPTRGWMATGFIEDAGGILFGEKDFIKGHTMTKFYYSPFNNIILELKTRFGLATAYADTEKVPIYERFYAGGADTIRGYKERKVGPRDPGSGDPIGGDATLVGNAEVLFPIYEKIIRGAVFYDIGNVWDRVSNFMDGGLKQGTGVGVRVKTPLGPLKLDLGYPLSENQGDKKQLEFYFSMSHGF